MIPVDVKIRFAEFADLNQLTEIYNEAIREKFRTAHTEEFLPEERAGWLNEHNDQYPVFVAEQSGNLLGYFSISPYRCGRAALQSTVEVSYYVRSSARRKGIASILMQHSFEFCIYTGYKALLAIVLDKNPESAQLLKKSGFSQWGFLPAVAEVDGIACGHIYFGKHL